MPRIGQLTLDQINRQIDTIDLLVRQLADLQTRVNNIGHNVTISDPIHAPITTNNLTFQWTGGTGTLTWAQGFIKDKNWSAQTIARPAFKSSAPGQQHVFNVAAGSLSLSPSSYFWLGWDSTHQVMKATANADELHGNKDIQVVCQIYTGTAGQTGVAGGGGSNGGSDLSGVRYKNF